MLLNKPIMPFAQLVIGPPGSGKSTYCNGMHQFMSAIGRKCSVVNLDPANDQTSYPCALDVRNLVTLEEIMSNDELGPNGAVLYALEELEHNMDWLSDRLKKLGEDYVLFDCPGQVELFTHHDSLRKIFFKIQKLGYRVCFSYVSPPCAMTDNIHTARSGSSDRLVCFDTPFSIYLHAPPLSSSNDPNGSHPNQCPHQD